MPHLAGIHVEGVSIAGLETCIDLPELRMAFDLGRAYDFALSRPLLCFTHPHMDHIGAVGWHCSTRAMRKMPVPTYLVGREWAAEFDALMEAWRALDRSELPHRRIAIGPGEEHALQKDLLLRPFRSHHRAPCQGYGIWRRTNRLRPQYKELPEQEIAALRQSLRQSLGPERASETLLCVEEQLELAFTGDTRMDVLDSSPELRKAHVLVLECSFLDDRVPVERARELGHVHLDEIIARAEEFENEALLLTHFSERYSSAEIERLLERRLPEGLRRRVTPLLEGRRN
ncbi:MAG: MBL fold metallo-hydrolase [Planctomycetia bacterium]